MLYLITYDLNTPGQDYQNLYDEIKNFGTWWHYLDSTWLIDTSLSSSQMQKKLKQHMVIDKNDYLFIVKITKDYQGWLPQKAWDWIKKRDINNPY